MLAAPAPARANDRPFQEARTAVAEDDDNAWSLESWFARTGAVRSLAVEPEYTFDPQHSVQFEFSRRIDRDGAATGQAIEIEYKHLFNRFDRDGWGAGLSVALGVDRTRGDGTVTALNLKLPVSFGFGDDNPVKVHLNPGWARTSDARGGAVAAIGAEAEVVRRRVLFAEWAVQRGERFAQLGLRWWVTKDKVALDIAAQHSRADGEVSRGVVIGLGLYDL